MAEITDNNGHSPEVLGRDSAIVLFLFAFVFRLIYILQSTDNPLFGFPVVDAHIYAKWAARMSQGEWLWDHVGNYLPIYPAFLALQQIVFGANPFVNKILQSLMGSLSAVMLAQIATRTWNRRVGLIAGFLIATNWMLVIFEAEKYAESFSIFFQSLTIWLLIHRVRRPLALLAAGFTFALSAATRANLFLVLPFIIGWLIYQFKVRKPAAIKAAVIFCVGTIVLIGPVVFRNYQITGTPMLRAQATWSLYSGLSPQFEGLHPPTGILFQKYMRMPYQEGLRSESEVERFWAQKIWDVLKKDPYGIAINFMRRLTIFFNVREWSQEFDVYIYRQYSGLLSLPWTGFWLIGPFGLLGLFLMRPANRNQALLMMYTVVGIISIVPFKASDRYRLPVVVLLTLFAAFTLWQLFKWSQTKNKRALAVSLPLLGAVCLLCWFDWQHLKTRKTARHDFFIGLRHETFGRPDDAIRAYKKSMKDFGWDPDSPYRIGHILLQQGNIEQAKGFLKEARRREPAFPEVMNDLARIHLKTGNYEEAERQALASLKLYPNMKDTLLLLAAIKRSQGNAEDEISYLSEAAYETRDPKIAMALAMRLIELGNYQNAITWYNYVINSPKVDDPLKARAGMLAGITLARFLEDKTGARGYWQLVVEKFGDATYFSQPANFLLGSVDEATFRNRMEKVSDLKAIGEYVIGLKHRLGGDEKGARIAYKRCIELSSEKDPLKMEIPYKWAYEDLQRLQKQGMR
jgi:tetratricopeptide (TPR) repeat protein